MNDDYCLPLLVAWQSLCESSREVLSDLRVAVLFEKLADSSTELLTFHARRLGLRLELRPYELPDLPYNIRHGGTRANYGRLTIGTVFAECGRVLYLDADVVVRDDLRLLLDADLAGEPFAAVRDPVNPTYEFGSALPGWPQLGIPADREYFNSGVLLFDVAACSDSDLFGRAFRAVAEHPEQLRLWDQDALNLAADDRWLRLPMRWNTVPFSALLRTPWIRYRAEKLMPVSALVAAEDSAAIMHYVSPSKPWKNLLPAGPANELYQGHLDTVRAAESLRKHRVSN